MQTMRCFPVVYLLCVVMALNLSSHASGSEEEFAVWRRVTIECEPCGKAGDVAVEATVHSGSYRSMKVSAFGREHVLDAKTAKQLAGFPLSSVRVTHEVGYPSVGGYSVHLRLERTFYDEKKTLLQEVAVITVCEKKPGEVAVSKSRKLLTQTPAPITLKNLVYVDMHAAGYTTQHPLVCGPGRDFPLGRELAFRQVKSMETVHAVFPAGVTPPEILDGNFVLHGHFQGIQKRDSYKFKKPDEGYRYLVVSSWEHMKSK